MHNVITLDTFQVKKLEIQYLGSQTIFWHILQGVENLKAMANK